VGTAGSASVPSRNPIREHRELSDRGWRLLLPLALGLASLLNLFARFHAGASFLAFYDDDFFYYLRIAHSIAAGHGSTYDGTHLTNGYHPLWMLTLVGLTRLAGTGLAFFYLLQCVLLVSVLITYVLAERTFRALAPEDGWAGPLLAAWLATCTMMMIGGAMEVALAIPLMAALFWYRMLHFEWVPRKAWVLGLLGSALVLARLDSALLVITMGLLEIAWAADVPWKQRLRCAMTFLAGASPVAAYLALNRLWFHTAMPVSGQAKQLRAHHWPAPLLAPQNFVATAQRYSAFYPLLACTVAGLAIFFLRRRAVRSSQAACLLSFLAFPFLYAAMLSVASDWNFFFWYIYPLVGSGLAATALFLSLPLQHRHRARRALRPLRWAAFTVLLLVWAGFFTVSWVNAKRQDKVVFSDYLAGVEISRFAETHPGIYAMGDRAGVTGYLLHAPLVQTEGLVMDRPFLNNIRAQRPLKTVLDSYGVRYYIATNLQRSGACWLAVEPVQAGPDSPHMRDTFCSAPVALFRHNGYQTLVFDMNAERASSTRR
jgi:hypothetical protein